MSATYADGYRAAQRFYGTGATDALAAIGDAATAAREALPDGPQAYLDLLDVIERRTATRDALQPQ